MSSSTTSTTTFRSLPVFDDPNDYGPSPNRPSLNVGTLCLSNNWRGWSGHGTLYPGIITYTKKGGKEHTVLKDINKAQWSRERENIIKQITPILKQTNSTPIADVYAELDKVKKQLDELKHQLEKKERELKIKKNTLKKVHAIIRVETERNDADKMYPSRLSGHVRNVF